MRLEEHTDFIPENPEPLGAVGEGMKPQSQLVVGQELRFQSPVEDLTEGLQMSLPGCLSFILALLNSILP